ncbi:MAG: 16S rRNA (cytosine(1402)-N(4))-methyltransferase RsmH [Candidatus Fermentibacteraceae bacterium]|nr:16S rRNA (cytosine(1402)-N(4))-methyltransferase RsmH [Candidatus Fermentibacteraceae bacterium]
MRAERSAKSHLYSSGHIRKDETGTHVPVLLDSVVSFFSGGITEGLLVDGTAGAGGHLAAIAEVLPKMSLLGVDRDPVAISILRSRFNQDSGITVRQASYTEIPAIMNEIGFTYASGALFDLGLSSIQLDDSSRGFSYRSDGPLDMRFNGSSGATADELLNRCSEREIADIIYNYGEEGRSRRIAKAIVRERPVHSTQELASIISGSVRGNPVKILSRVFQALRIAVNRELEQLDDLLENLHTWTESGARIAFITFHSLEDRKIKLLFRDSGYYSQFSPVWIVADENERRENPRARSARLRMGIRL